MRLSRSSASSPFSIYEVGVAGDPERCTSRGSRLRETASRGCAPITCSSGTNWLAAGRHPAGQDLGHLHPGKALFAVGVAQHHGQREAQVRDVGERVARIDRQRREDRKHVGLEVPVEVLPVRPGEVVTRMDEVDPVLGQCRASRRASGMPMLSASARARSSRWPRAGPPGSCHRPCARRCRRPTAA